MFVLIYKYFLSVAKVNVIYSTVKLHSCFTRIIIVYTALLSKKAVLYQYLHLQDLLFMTMFVKL